MSVLINLVNWSRGREVIQYATAHRISFAEAIEQLVNNGLSHQ